jgi:hypothetical protein
MEFGLSDEALAAIKKRFTPQQWAAFAGGGSVRVAEFAEDANSAERESSARRARRAQST